MDPSGVCSSRVTILPWISPFHQSGRPRETDDTLTLDIINYLPNAAVIYLISSRIIKFINS